MPPLTKSDFLHFLNCPNSLWLKTKKPELYPAGEFTAFQQKLVKDGHEVERQVQRYVDGLPDSEAYSSQWVFETGKGLFARADLVRRNDDGTIDIFEVKSSTSVKSTLPEHHLKDATFQMIVAERCGQKVAQVYLVHLNKDYVREYEREKSARMLHLMQHCRISIIDPDRWEKLACALAEEHVPGSLRRK